MANAYWLDFNTQITIGSTRIPLDSRILYFPNESILIKPSFYLSPFGGGPNLYKPEIFLSSDAKNQYRVYSELKNAVIQIEVDNNIMEWARLFSEFEPSLEFKRKLFNFLIPTPPKTIDGIVININRPEKGEVMTSVYIPDYELFLSYKFSYYEPGLVDINADIKLDLEADNDYKEKLARATEINQVQVVMSFAQILKELGEDKEIFLDALVDYVYSNVRGRI